jgi:tripeptidyl-peptidase-1
MDQCEINPDECQGIDSEQYVARVNVDWQKIGLKGVSILVASGDSGTNGRTDPDCDLPYLKPDFPSCSPYVTSVGATQLENVPGALNNAPPICSEGFECAASGDEVAVSFDQSYFASGGGFSWYSPMPSYQTQAVSSYLNSGVTLPPASYYNNTNRGFPDVSAIGSACLIYDGGPTPVGGTSCSAPIFGGVMGLLNNWLTANGQAPLGFLNPFLYKMQSECSNCFQDITSGDNLCTEDGCSSSCEGFYCAKGWDPVSGLGTPNAGAMLQYVQQNL